MSNKECPCKGCVPPLRRPGCHESCLLYLSWQKKHIRHLAAIREARAKEHICDDYTAAEIRKNRKKKNES